MDERTEPGKHTGGLFRARGLIALIGFLAITGFLLTTEHRAHVMGFLPFALLLACPVLHVFHHSGRHGNHEQRSDSGIPSTRHEHHPRGGE